MSETQPEYFTLDFALVWKFFRSPKLWLIAVVIGAWVLTSYKIFKSSYIQYSPDSFLYKALSQQPLTLNFLVHGDRSPTLPILLKLFKSEGAFVYFQLFFFYVSWLTLFMVLRKLFKTYFAYLALLCMLCSLSVAQIFFSWHKLILTESVSLSGAVLLLALLCRFMTIEKVSSAAVSYTLVAWVLWQFTRDANTFFSLLIAIGFFILCSIARYSEQANDKWKKGQALGLVVCVFAFFQLFSINSSERWQFPLVDVIALRVLPSPELTKEFTDMGMPMNDKVACFKGQTAVDCHKDWSGFGTWFTSGKARTDYQNWLLLHFPRELGEIFTQWEKIWTTETILYGRSLESPASIYATKLAAPKGQAFLLFIALSFIAATLAFCVALEKGLKHWLSILLMFYIVNIPIAFIAYHGDALDIDRHTLNVQLNTYLTGWTLILWSVSFILDSFRTLVFASFKKMGAAIKR